MPRYTRGDIQRLVVGQILAKLRNESIVDIDDGEFIAKALAFQFVLAEQLIDLYPEAAPSYPMPRPSKASIF